MKHLSALACILLLSVLSCCGGVPVPQEDPRIRQGREMYSRSEFDRARQHFQALLAETERSGDSLLASRAMKWLGSIFLAYEQPEEALTWYRRSLALLDAGIARSDSAGRSPEEQWRDERQNVLSNTAVVYKNTGRFDDAEALLRDVLRSDSLRGDALRIAFSLNNLGDLFNRRALAARVAGQETDFLRLHEHARRYFQQSLDARPIPDAWLNLGNNYALVNGADSAIICYRRAEEIYREQGNPVQRALALGNIGVLARRMQRPAEAAAALRASIGIVEELRGNIASIDIRSSFISDKFYIYENLIDILVDADSVVSAFEIVERAKARSFLDMIGSKAVGEGKERPPDVQVLVDREQALQRRVALLLTVPDSSAVLIDVIEEHQEVLALLREKDPEYVSVKSVEPAPVAELQSLLDDSTALIEYFIGRNNYYIFLLRADTLFVRRRPHDSRRSLERDVESLRRTLYYDFPMRKAGMIRSQRLTGGATLQEALDAWYAEELDNAWQYDLVAMYSRFFAPVAGGLDGITQLYIVPHGPLHHLPFQALVSPLSVDRRSGLHLARPRYLIEDYAVAYLPSASVLEFALQKELREARSALIVGDPVYADPKYRRRPLDGALVEADTVARYAAEALVLKREEAEESLVKRRIGEQDLVHFATHGELNTEDPLQSRILLAAAEPDSVNDGNLTVAKIFNLDLRAVLVTLSACQTAQVASEAGGFAPGDDLVGLTRSFMYAGTPAVIASLWYVDDAATLAWMRNFYRYWLDGGQSRLQAARRAALQMLADPADPDWIFPYYWSAFVYLGDTR